MIYSQLMIKNNADAFENLQVRLEFVHQTAAIFGDFNLTENSSKRSPDDAASVSSTSGAGPSLLIFLLFLQLYNSVEFDC